MSATDALSPAPPRSPSSSMMGAGGRCYAGFWIRVGACLLDGAILMVIGFPMGFVIGLVGSLYGGDTSMLNGLENVLGMIIGLIYYVAFTASSWQATPGKRLVGIHLIRADGGRVGAGRAFGRYLANFLSMITLFIGYMMVGWTREKTALHDLVCSTRVVYGKTSAL